MGKKYLFVSHKTHQYKLGFQDLSKIIFRAKKTTPCIPSYAKYSKSASMVSEDET